jgi:Flp pilus assembly pilin Flp
MKKHFQKQKARRGQTLVEYALILAFISVVAISVLINLGNTIRSSFGKINSQLQVAQ